jgi:uncharacterized protein (DUF58 family)
MLRKFYTKLPRDGSSKPMWKSFLQSMGLLAIAMVIALYSTNTARTGDSITTVLSAVAALGIAGWVGIRFVPQLAQGVNWAWMPLTQFRVTRDGGIFAGALFVVLAAAVNTSNNLLYMVLSALLAVVVISGLLSIRNFNSVRMELILPGQTFAGEPFPLSVRVHNRGKLFPAFSLSAEPPGNALYFSVIQPQGTVVHTSETQFTHRGSYTFKKLRTASRFPFGFFVKARQYPVEAQCICYPKILPQDQLEISIQDVLGTHQRMERGLGSDLHTIRDYMPSDSARHVHWKATAKTSTLKTREFAADDSPRILLAFDRYGKPDDAERFEHLVSQAASLAFHLMRNGMAVTLVSDDWRSLDETSQSALHSILNYLALVKMSFTASPPEFDRQAGALLLSLRGGSD